MTDLPSDPLSLSFDIYQRYRQVTELIHAIAPARPLSLLDVGGEMPYLRLFLPEASLTVVDRAFPGSRDSSRGLVVADGTQLPFRAASIDLAVSVDSLEHVPTPERLDYLRELRRVSKLGVVLAAPFDSEDVREAERVVADLYHALYGSPHRWLEEHRRYGLPSLPATLEFFRASGDHVSVVPNGYLPRWVAMLTAQVVSAMGERERMAYERLCRYYSEHFYSHDRRTPAYRHVILAARTAPSRLPVPDEIGPGPFESASVDFTALMTPVLEAISRDAAALRDTSAEITILRSRVSALEEHLLTLTGSLGGRLVERFRALADRMAPPKTGRQKALRGVLSALRRLVR